MWERVYGKPERIPHGHFSAEPDSPNTDDALEYWLGWSDIYVFEHIQLFDSWEDLIEKLERVDLPAVSEAMRRFNREQREDLLKKWRAVLDVATSTRRTATDLMRRPLNAPSFDEAMQALWQVDPLPPDRPALINERCRELERAPVAAPPPARPSPQVRVS